MAMSAWIEAVQRTEPVTCFSSMERISAASATGVAAKLQTTGMAGFRSDSFGEFGGQLVLGALHQARVVGPRDVELDGAADAEFLGFGHRGVDALDGAGEHDLAGRVEVGDIHIRSCGKCPDLLFLAADERGHGPFGGEAGLFHEGTALADDAQAVFEREGAGGGVGGELAEREPGGGDRSEVRQPFADQGECHQAMKVERGLAARGFREFLIRSLEHDLRKRKSEDLIGLGGHLADAGGGFHEVLAHARFLGTLTGEKKNDLAHVEEMSRGMHPL